MSLRDIVNVQISRETTAIDRESFGIAMFVVEDNVFDSGERVRSYSSIAGVAEDFATTDSAYKMALAAFSQEVRLTRIKIGQKDVSEDWDEALTAISEVDDVWYGLACDTVDAAEIVEIAAWVEARTKIYIAKSSDSDVITNSTTDVGSDLQDANYARTALLWHSLATTTYPDCAWLGNCLVRDPGSQTWKFKTLPAITVDSFTATQKDAMIGKNVNFYERIAGVNITREGTMAEGEYIDVIRGIDWLTARIQERVYERLVNSPKVPYTNAGIAVIENCVREQLDIAVDRGVIAPEPPYTVTVPDVLDTDSADRADRILRDVEFEGRLAGAIHSVTITGVVTV